MGDDERILLDPPHWPGQSDDHLTTFVEAVNNLLDSGIFRPALASELVRYRDAASDQISARIARRRCDLPL
jgi:hypothetical protein